MSKTIRLQPPVNQSQNNDLLKIINDMFVSADEGNINLLHRVIHDNMIVPSVCNDDGDYILHIVCRNSNKNYTDESMYQMVKYLLDTYNLSPNVQTLKGETPLHITSRLQYAKTSGLLIEYDADVNILDIYNRNPIFNACNGIITENVPNEQFTSNKINNEIMESIRGKFIIDKIIVTDDFFKIDNNSILDNESLKSLIKSNIKSFKEINCDNIIPNDAKFFNNYYEYYKFIIEIDSYYNNTTSYTGRLFKYSQFIIISQIVPVVFNALNNINNNTDLIPGFNINTSTEIRVDILSNILTTLNKIARLYADTSDTLNSDTGINDLLQKIFILWRNEKNIYNILHTIIYYSAHNNTFIPSDIIYTSTPNVYIQDDSPELRTLKEYIYSRLSNEIGGEYNEDYLMSYVKLFNFKNVSNKKVIDIEQFDNVPVHPLQFQDTSQPLQLQYQDTSQQYEDTTQQPLQYQDTSQQYQDTSQQPLQYQDTSQQYQDTSQQPLQYQDTSQQYEDTPQQPLQYQDTTQQPLQYQDTSQQPLQYQDTSQPQPLTYSHDPYPSSINMDGAGNDSLMLSSGDNIISVRDFYNRINIKQINISGTDGLITKKYPNEWPYLKKSTETYVKYNLCRIPHIYYSNISNIYDSPYKLLDDITNELIIDNNGVFFDPREINSEEQVDVDTYAKNIHKKYNIEFSFRLLEIVKNNLIDHTKRNVKDVILSKFNLPDNLYLNVELHIKDMIDHVFDKLTNDIISKIYSGYITMKREDETSFTINLTDILEKHTEKISITESDIYYNIDYYSTNLESSSLLLDVNLYLIRRLMDNNSDISKMDIFNKSCLHYMVDTFNSYGVDHILSGSSYVHIHELKKYVSTKLMNMCKGYKISKSNILDIVDSTYTNYKELDESNQNIHDTVIPIITDESNKESTDIVMPPASITRYSIRRAIIEFVDSGNINKINKQEIMDICDYFIYNDDNHIKYPKAVAFITNMLRLLNILELLTNNIHT